MNDPTTHLFCRSNKYKEDYQKRTQLFILYWSSFIFVNCYGLWVLTTSPANQINSKSSAIEIFSAFNPLKTQEEYIDFVLIGIFPTIFVSICIFWARLEKFKYLNTKILHITLEEVTQEFNQKVTDKILWSQVTKVALKKKGHAEILYVDICEEKDCRIRLYGLEPWEELIHKIKVICKDKNLELEESHVRIGSRGYLLGPINFISILMTPSIALSNQLRILGLEIYANLLLFSLGVLVSIDMAFLTEPLEIDRSKYQYSTILFVFLWISVATFFFINR
jgi:hypothetical protein